MIVRNNTGLTDGTHTVGKGIDPGVWETSGARDETKGIDVCVWQRYGATGQVIQGGGAGVGETIRVRVEPTDLTFSTSGCERWHKTWSRPAIAADRGR